MEETIKSRKKSQEKLDEQSRKNLLKIQQKQKLGKKLGKTSENA